MNKEMLKKDFYEEVNKKWLQETTIPNDKPAINSFQILADDIEKLLMKDLQAMSEEKITLSNSCETEMVKLYKIGSDFEKRDNEGFDPIRSYVKQIDSIDSVEKLLNFIKTETKYGTDLPIEFGVSSDMKNANKYILYLSMPSLFLPDKTYYDTEKGKNLIATLKDTIVELLKEYGYSDDDSVNIFESSLAFDLLISKYSLSAEESSDYTVYYNPLSLEDVDKLSKNFSVLEIINSVLTLKSNKVIIANKHYFDNIDNIINEENINIIKDWIKVNFIFKSTGYLSEKIRVIASKYTLALTGASEIRVKEKNLYSQVAGSFSHVLGNYYALKYHGNEVKEDVLEMIRNIISVYNERLTNNKWLKKETIAQAIKKLNKIETLIGFPDKIYDVYYKLIINKETYFENMMEISRIFREESLQKEGSDIDKTKWSISANVVNAYYHPFNNLICFPAAILQEPFYSINQSKEANYGAIGAVIAHEISHAFDSNGAKFDEFGNMNNWWDEEDFEKFNQLKNSMIQLWDNLSLNGKKINGTLTVSENIADLGGLTCALECIKRLNLTKFDEFFYSWAKIWRGHYRSDYLDLLINIDVHSPAKLRANITPRHLKEFYTTFDIKSGDEMYLDEESRIEIY